MQGRKKRKRGGCVVGHGPQLGSAALKKAGYAVNTILYPEQRAFIETLAAARRISMSEAFRDLISEAMERAPNRR